MNPLWFAGQPCEGVSLCSGGQVSVTNDLCPGCGQPCERSLCGTCSSSEVGISAKSAVELAVVAALSDTGLLASWPVSCPLTVDQLPETPIVSTAKSVVLMALLTVLAFIVFCTPLVVFPSVLDRLRESLKLVKLLTRESNQTCLTLILCTFALLACRGGSQCRLVFSVFERSLIIRLIDCSFAVCSAAIVSLLPLPARLACNRASAR